MSGNVAWVLLGLGAWAVVSIAVAVLLSRGGLGHLTRGEPSTVAPAAPAHPSPPPPGQRGWPNGLNSAATRGEPAGVVETCDDCVDAVVESGGLVDISLSSDAPGEAGDIGELPATAVAGPGCPRTRLDDLAAATAHRSTPGGEEPTACEPVDALLDELVELRRRNERLEAQNAVLTCAAAHASARDGRGSLRATEE